MAGNSSATEDDLKDILFNQYELVVDSIKQLVSFNCQNFEVNVKVNSNPTSSFLESHLQMKSKCYDSNEAIEGGTGAPNTKKNATATSVYWDKSRNSTKYIFKVLNEDLCTSARLPKTRKQIELCEYLHSEGFICPKHVLTTEGDLFVKMPKSER